jgi:hypothetical protein
MFHVERFRFRHGEQPTIEAIEMRRLRPDA